MRKLNIGLLGVNYDDIVWILGKNPDKSSKQIDEKFMGMIDKYYPKFTGKQTKWITEKLKFIIRQTNIIKWQVKDIIILDCNNNSNGCSDCDCNYDKE